MDRIIRDEKCIAYEDFPQHCITLRDRADDMSLSVWILVINGRCVEDKNSKLLIRLMGIAEYSTTCVSHVPLPLVTTQILLTGFACSLIPAAEDCICSPAGWLVLTVEAGQRLLTDNLRYCFKSYLNLSSTHHSSQTAKTKYMTQHNDMWNKEFAFLHVSLFSLSLSVLHLAFISPLDFSYCFTQSSQQWTF